MPGFHTEALDMSDHRGGTCKRQHHVSGRNWSNLVRRLLPPVIQGWQCTLQKTLETSSVSRPCLCAAFPVKNGRSVVLDIGANAECRPEFLVQFAIMGKIYSETMLGVKNPRVGLLSNGEEEGKGNNLVRETNPLLAKSDLNFIGNVEGKELFEGLVDVLVTDGFTGNVLLKSTEAVSKLIIEILKDELASTFRTKVGALLAAAFGKIREMLIHPRSAAPL